MSQYDRLHSASKVKPPPLYSEYKQFEKLQIKKKQKNKKVTVEGRDESFYDGGISIWHATTSVRHE